MNSVELILWSAGKRSASVHPVPFKALPRHVFLAVRS